MHSHLSCFLSNFRSIIFAGRTPSALCLKPRCFRRFVACISSSAHFLQNSRYEISTEIIMRFYVALHFVLNTAILCGIFMKSCQTLFGLLLIRKEFKLRIVVKKYFLFVILEAKSIIMICEQIKNKTSSINFLTVKIQCFIKNKGLWWNHLLSFYLTILCPIINNRISGWLSWNFLSLFLWKGFYESLLSGYGSETDHFEITNLWFDLLATKLLLFSLGLGSELFVDIVFRIRFI